MTVFKVPVKVSNLHTESCYHNSNLVANKANKNKLATVTTTGSIAFITGPCDHYKLMINAKESQGS